MARNSPCFRKLSTINRAPPRKQTSLVARSPSDPIVAALRSDFQNKRLRLDVTEAECPKRLLGIFREARTALQDNGANLLFLAVGFLLWKESPTSDIVRRAPLLMLPLELRRKNGSDQFSIKLADDEPRINTSLLEMLRREHGIEVRGIDPLPLDQSGLDIKGILNSFRSAMVDMDGWHVEEEGAIGLFSFTKFLMWRDLNEHADLLDQQGILASLLTGNAYEDFDDSGYPKIEELDEAFEPKDVFCPLSMDSSQMAAVLAASAGKSFILNGPPGTGKSQTIANMIAHSLTVGKTVLFVAEKAAALEVVYKRLQAIGLGDYCLELHSRRAQKKHVIQQLKDAWQSPHHGSSGAWNSKSDNLVSVRSRLNQHSHSLHKKRNIGESLFWGLSKTIGYQADDSLKEPVKLAWRSAEIARMDASDYERLSACARQLQEAAVAIGSPVEHPWRLVRTTNWKVSTPRVLRELLDAAIAEFPAYRAVQESVQALFPVRLDANLEAVISLAEALAEKLAESPGAGAALVMDDPRNTAMFLEELATRLDARYKLEKPLFAKYHRSLLDQDLAAMAEHYTAVLEMSAVKRYFATKNLRQQLVGHCLLKHAKPPLEEIRNDLIAAMEYRRELDWFSDNERRIASLLGRYVDEDSAKKFTRDNLDAIRRWRVSFRAALDAVTSFAGDNADTLRQHYADIASDPARSRAESARIQALTAEWKKAIASWLDAKNEILAVLQPDAEWFARLENGAGDELLDQLRHWRDNLSSLQEWTIWLRERENAREKGLGSIVEQFEQGKIGADALFALFDSSFCYWWTEGTADADESYPIAKLRNDIANFKRLDEQHGNLAREEIRVRLATRAAKAKAGCDNFQRTVLQKQMALQKRHVSIRKLMDTTGGLIRGIMPCFLMSPISVAQYLTMDCEKFDLIIFDEASQIPTWDAAGVMARGRQVVIAGDPKQLPPTNFFQRQTNSDEEAEDTESISASSILSMAVTLSLASNATARIITAPKPLAIGIGCARRCLKDWDGVFIGYGRLTGFITARLHNAIC